MVNVVIVCGSEKDFPFAEEIRSPLVEKGYSVELMAASAHKEARKGIEIIEKYNDPKIIFVTIAGRSNALSGFMAGNSKNIVIACPPHKTHEEYMIDIHSTLRMPSKTPVLTVLDPKNCALAIDRILQSQK
ncbi:AIR carboxylase family protein [Candidatus Gracilibacteria bacterium]|nr:AIR carboxylase family protein [Candidatus Gracilibacteria bacterium]MCF7819591.1 AIR carboxylase family protein [Candidatus Gracilibacteria bacterium]